MPSVGNLPETTAACVQSRSASMSMQPPGLVISNRCPANVAAPCPLHAGFGRDDRDTALWAKAVPEHGDSILIHERHAQNAALAIEVVPDYVFRHGPALSPTSIASAAFCA